MRAIFLYGTAAGQSRGGLILAASPRRIISARTPGLLAGLGAYPGLLAAPNGGQWVFGEFAEFQDTESQKMSALLTQLDSGEQYAPASEAASLSLRRSLPVELKDGSESAAWAYLYNRPYDPRRLIGCGDWRQRGN